MAKNKTQQNKESRLKTHKKIWREIGLEKAIRKHGFEAVKQALSKWTEYQRENARLLKEQRELEERLSAVKAKL